MLLYQFFCFLFEVVFFKLFFELLQGLFVLVQSVWVCFWVLLNQLFRLRVPHLRVFVFLSFFDRHLFFLSTAATSLFIVLCLTTHTQSLLHNKCTYPRQNDRRWIGELRERFRCLAFPLPGAPSFPFRFLLLLSVVGLGRTKRTENIRWSVGVGCTTGTNLRTFEDQTVTQRLVRTETCDLYDELITGRRACQFVSLQWFYKEGFDLPLTQQQPQVVKV